jgi:hypothetical protein
LVYMHVDDNTVKLVCASLSFLTVIFPYFLKNLKRCDVSHKLDTIAPWNELFSGNLGYVVRTSTLFISSKAC